jgi:hypothetical protein
MSFTAASDRMMHVSYGCYVGTITGFDTLRIYWAQMAGYAIIPGQDYGAGYVQADMPDLPWTEYSNDDLLGEWPEGAPDDPLVILLAHEEKQGRIKASHVPLVADALAELNVPPASPYALPTQNFIQGLRYAGTQNLDILFT